jgi:hypothetical protein
VRNRLIHPRRSSIDGRSMRGGGLGRVFWGNPRLCVGQRGTMMGDIELLNIESRVCRWVLEKNDGWITHLSSSTRSVLVGAGGPSISMAYIARGAKHWESSSVEKRNREIMPTVQVPVEGVKRIKVPVIGHCTCQRSISNLTIATV